MITEYRAGSPSVTLNSDIASEHPVYVFHSRDQKTLIYSTSLESILTIAKSKSQLNINRKAVSFLLQCGVVPPPQTAYEGIYVLGVGHSAIASTSGKKTVLNFHYDFPFLNKNRLTELDFHLCENTILEKLAHATLSKIDNSRPSFLFHSAGKDSNSVALAIAEAGAQEQVTLISHKSNGASDESQISKKIALQLGFRHKIIGINHDAKKHINDIYNYFRLAPIPVLDSATLAYPLYATEIPELLKCNMIDGGGNDAYMSTPTSKREDFFFKSSTLLSKLRPAVQRTSKSESILNKLTQSKAEWCGFNGFTFDDSQFIFEDCIDVRPFFSNLSQERKNWDNYDFKTDILTGIIAAEMHIRKFRNAASIWKANAILPFADKNVAKYLFNLPESLEFERKTGRNKIILRTLLKNRMGLDSDKIGKMGFTVNYESTLSTLSEHIEYEITNCELWNKTNITSLYTRLINVSNSQNANKHRAAFLIHRLFLLSSWANHSIYLKP